MGESGLDPGLWEELARQEPGSVCRRSAAVPHADGYRLKVLDADYLVLPQQRSVLRVKPSGQPDPDPGSVPRALTLIAVQYLIHARDIPPAQEWIGLQEVGGVNRFYISHGPSCASLVPLFEEAPEAVVKGAKSLGGSRLDYGDVAVALPVLPRLTVAFVYWEASEEFAAALSAMVDRTAQQHLPVNAMSVAVQEAIARLTEAAAT